MDTKRYITSGILELYVLERLEPAEMRKVEAMAAEYPEVREEISQIEFALETIARQLDPKVTPDVLDHVLSELPVSSPSAPPRDDAPKVPAEKISRGVLATFLPWLMVLGGLLGLGYYYQQASQKEAELEELQSKFNILEENCDESRQLLQSTQRFIIDLTNPATQEIILAGSENTPDKSAIVFYNTATKKTLFRAINLPPPPAGKQYQLWAIDADGPKDLGVLAKDLTQDELLEVDFISGAAAFAVSLEEDGGKPAPDLTQIQVIGKIS